MRLFRVTKARLYWALAGISFAVLVSATIAGVGLSAANHAQSDLKELRQIVPFDDVFVLEDTVRLDPSIPLGTMRALDVSQSGAFLITDQVAQRVYRFAASGQFLNELTVDECNPGAHFVPSDARFLENGHIVTYNGSGHVYLFDANGTCSDFGRSADFAGVIGICARQDSLFMLPVAYRDSSRVKVYSSDLELLGEIAVAPPQFPTLTATVQLQGGRNLHCFDDDAWYVYSESMDASPLRPKGNYVQHKPPFYRTRRRDIPPTMGSPSRYRAIGEASITLGLHRLTATVHMVSHSGLAKRDDSREGSGLTIVDHDGRFAAISTITPKQGLLGAGNGYAFLQGDYDLLPNGEQGNRMILRYRFIPPENLDE